MSDIKKRINEIKLESSELKMGVNSSVKKTVISTDKFEWLVDSVIELHEYNERLKEAVEHSERMRSETMKENHRLNEMIDSLRYVQYFLEKRR